VGGGLGVAILDARRLATRLGRRRAGRRGRGLGGTVGRLDQEHAVQHAHAAGELEPSRPVGQQLHRGGRECCQVAADAKVGEHHLRAAVAVLAPVEDQPQRHAGPRPQQAGGVAAVDDHGRGLHPRRQGRLSRPARTQDVPAEPEQREPAPERDNDLREAHRQPPPSTFSAAPFPF